MSAAIELAQVRGNQPGLMIVTVQDVWRRRSVLEEFHHRALKENPSIGLIGIIPSCGGIEIQSGTIEEPIVAENKHINRGARHFRTMDIVRNAFEPDGNTSAVRRGI